MERPFLYLRFLDFALRAPLEMTGEGNISTERSEWRDLYNELDINRYLDYALRAPLDMTGL